ncbi:hypothetical protein [Nonomuraea candida]|uniref:hypothetical protein n=1 Tax=Nonomuraea candida TaxID=359159 RepID=UPI0005BE9613|nr:hypothetical protein [Nonomuraea candida]
MAALHRAVPALAVLLGAVMAATAPAAAAATGAAQGPRTVQAQVAEFTVQRTETRQAGGVTPYAAKQAGAAEARAAILAAGVSCTGWTTTSALVWAAPGSVWYIYDVTVTALCTH